MAFARGSNPIWFEVDLTAHAFDDTFYMFVLQNQIPYIPAVVYHDINGTIPWNNPIQFNANGTLPIDIFWDTTAIYRLEFRQGNSQSDPLIYLVENYSPGSGGNSPIDTVAFDTENQITNPQFSIINFIDPFSLTATNPDPIQVAPGWYLNLSGTGTVALSRISLNDSLANTSNSPYALRITLSGTWTGTPYLSQRFDQNGMLWANKYVSNSVTARIEGAPQSISGVIYDSNGTLLQTVLASVAIDDTFVEYDGYGLLPATTNTDLPPAAWIEYRLLLPTSVDIYVTSFQLKASALPIAFSYEQDTIERQVDYTFHYYNHRLQFKPIPSFLVGWDFPLNPAQIFGDSVGTQAIGANKSYYAWDQTIVFQTVDNSIAVSRESTSLYMNLTATTTTQAAVIQYLTGTQAQLILNQMALEGVSVMFAGSTTTSKNFTVSLWWSVNPIGTGMASNNSLVTSLDANGYPTVAAGWTEITKLPLEKATFTTLNNIYQTSGFSYYMEPTAYLTGISFAIVVGSSSIPAGEKISIASISVVPGKIPTIPATQTLDQVLKECEFYYEKSYSTSSAAGAIDGQNSLISAQNAAIVTTQVGLYATGFNISFKNSKITTPAVNLFSPSTGAGTAVSGLVYTSNVLRNSGDLDLSNWTQTAIGTKNVYYVPANSTYLLGASAVSTTNPQAFINYQYVADARLGLV